MKKWTLFLATMLLAGCGRESAKPEPAGPPGSPSLQTSRPSPQPELSAVPTATNIPPAQPGQSIGGAAVDVITQRSTIEAGLRAKAQINAVTNKEQKEIDAVLKE